MNKANISQMTVPVKKIDIHWLAMSLVFLVSSLYFYFENKDILSLALIAFMFIVFAIRKIVPKMIFNILRILVTLAGIFYILRLFIS